MDVMASEGLDASKGGLDRLMEDTSSLSLSSQDLLQLQYEGVSVMKMFDRAKINVNLLIFLLNKKFFKK